MTTVALLLAAGALVIAYLALRRATVFEQRLTEANNRLLDLRTQLKEAEGRWREELSGLRMEMRQRAGELSFSPQMTIAEALQVHPKVADVLASFHLNGCSHCAVSDVDTLEGACQTYGIDQKALMAALNRLVDARSGGAAGPINVADRKLEI
jgi:hybrid cluster-associated redox disulfide protein